MRRVLFALVVVVVGCGPGARGDDPGDPAPDSAAFPDAANMCPSLPAAGPAVSVAVAFVVIYSVADLRPVPGVPNPLGGTVVKATDQNTLLVAGGSESSSGAIYSIGITRDPCGHITGFSGNATQIAATPFVDANLLYAN